MKYNKFFVFSLLFYIFLIGCNAKQPLDDPDNATVSGYVYKRATPTDSVIDTIIRDTSGVPIETLWTYIDWTFSDPAESVHVWIESDITSPVPYTGPDIDGYTDSTGFYSIPIYLGHKVKTSGGDIVGYEYTYFADVRIFVIYKSFIYDFGGGMTLERGREFRLFPIALTWVRPQ